MGLDKNNNYIDDRTPVIFQGIKEKTIALKNSESVQDAIESLKAGGTEVSRSEKAESAETVNKALQSKKEEYEEQKPKSGTKASGYVSIVASSIATINKGTEFVSDSGVSFVATEKVIISSTDAGVPIKISIEAKETGKDGNVGINSIRKTTDDIPFIESITNTEPTSGGSDEKKLSNTEQASLETTRSLIKDYQRGLSDLESDISELRDKGILGEGEYTVKFIYDQPNVSVSTTNRFVEHETVDGPVIRQKVGTGKRNITLEGVCTTAEASLLDNFVNENQIYVKSNRYEGNVSIRGISTKPLEDGGAMNLDGQYTHDFALELTEIEQ